MRVGGSKSVTNFGLGVSRIPEVEIRHYRKVGKLSLARLGNKIKPLCQKNTNRNSGSAVENLPLDLP